MSNNLPTYQDLFGTDNYYTVPDSRSVLSPAAYLVELLKLVENNIQGQNLQTRRPDIYNLLLDKINTENELPKLNIVNQILQKNIGGADPATATYPFSLPYDQSLDEVRHYLAQNKITLQHIWKTFNKGYEGDPERSTSIYLETIGISREQWSQYSTDPAADTLWEFYGFASNTSDADVVNNLGDVQTFLTQSGLTQQLLQELVYEDLSEDEVNAGALRQNFYINIGSSSVITIQDQTLGNLTPANTARIMRFVRMAQAIGWSFTDFDWALQTIRPLINSRNEALPYLAWIQEQVQQNGLTVNQCCGFLGQIKNYGKKNGSCFFDVLFNNPLNPALPPVPSNDTYLTWNVPQPGISSSATDKQIESALSAALQLSQRDLLLAVSPIVRYGNDNNNALQLTPANLALLYRISLLPVILNQSVSDLFVATEILSQKIGLSYCLQHADYPIGNVLNIKHPDNSKPPLTGKITGISPQSLAGSITYTVTVSTASGAESVQVVFNLPGQVFSSLSIGSDQVSGLTPGNVDQFAYTGVLINNLLVSTTDLYASTLYALSHLSKLFSWIDSTTISLGQLEFVTLGKSYDPIVQNSIVSKNEEQNFLTQLRQSVKKEFITKGTLYSQVHNDVSQLYISLVSSTLFAKLVNDQTEIDNLRSNASEYCRWIINGSSSESSIVSIYEGLKNNSLIADDGIVITDPNEIKQDTVVSIIQTAITDTLNQATGLSLSAQIFFPAASSSPAPSAEVVTQAATLAGNLAQYISNSYDKQQKVLIHNLAGLYNTSASIAGIIRQWADANITEIFEPSSSLQNTPTNLLHTILHQDSSQNDVHGNSIVKSLEKLQQANLLLTALSLSPAEAAFFKTVHPPTSLFPVSFHSAKEIWTFKRLVKAFGDAQNNLLNILQNADNWQSGLARLTGWNSSELDTLAGSTYLNITSPTVSSINLLNNYFTLAAGLGIKISTLWDLAQLASSSTLPVDYSEFSAALQGGLQAKLKDSPATLNKLQNTLSERLRDKLVPATCYNLSAGTANFSDNYGNTSRGLYAYLLIDVEVSGVVQTTRIREAISAVQLYIYRCLNQLEPETTVTGNLTGLWQWMQSYREWQANMEVFLYPENYLEPELRLDKTDLFSRAEHALHQADLTKPENVETIFRDYMNGLEEIGSLQIISCAAHTYQNEDAEGIQSFKELCMIGSHPGVPGRYYYRLAKFRESKNQFVPYDWGQWKKINIVMNTVEYQPGEYGIPKPVHAFGRWYIFWVEQKLQNTTSGQSNNTTYKYYTATVNATCLDFNKNWTPQKEVVKPAINFPVQTTDNNGNITIAYKISTKQNAEVQWLAVSEKELMFVSLQTFYYYQPDSFPETGTGVISICQGKTNIYVGTPFGLYTLDDTTLTPVEPNTIRHVQCLNVITNSSADIINVGTNAGLYFGSGGSGTWNQATFNSSSVPDVQCINDFSGQTVVGTSMGLFFYNTNSYIPVTSASTNGLPANANIQCLVSGSSRQYAGTTNGLYYRETGGNWTLLTKIPSNVNVQCLANLSNTIYVGTTNGLYTGSGGNNGTWNPITFPNGLIPDVQCLDVFGSNQMVVGTSSGLFWGHNGSYTPVTPASTNGLPANANIQCLVSGSSLQYAGTSNGLYYRETNGHWTLLTNIPSNINVQCLVYLNSKIYAGTTNGLYTGSEGNNGTWSLISWPSQETVTIPPKNVYPANSVFTSIYREPNWFIVNGQKDQYLNISYPAGNATTNFNVYRLNSTAIPSLGVLFNKPNGINALLTTLAQQTSESPFKNLNPAVSYIPTTNYPPPVIDFSDKSAMRMYYWELFFHLPFLIANELNRQQHFAHARSWYEYVFNPLINAFSSGNTDQYPNDRYWRFLGLRQINNKTLNSELSEVEMTELRKDLLNVKQLYASDSKPFDPQVIAQLRPIAYQKTIVMHYIDNLLNWGDMLYRENTRDSINEAEMLYVLAYNLLGEQPRDLGPYKLTPNRSYSNMFGFRCMIDGLIGTDNGLYYLDSPTGSWLLVPTQALQNIEITCLCSDDLTTKTYYAGTKGNGLFQSTDRINWQSVSQSDVGAINITALFFGTFYSTILLLVGTDQGLFQNNYSGEGPGDWTPSAYANNGGNVTNNVTVFTQIPEYAFFYIGTTDLVYYMNGDPLVCWGLGASNNVRYSVTAIATLTIPNVPMTIYIGTLSTGLFAVGKNQVNPIAGPWQSQEVTCLYVDEAENVIYAGIKNSGLFYLNSEASWVQVISTGTTMNSLTINCMIRQSPGSLYAGTNQGLYYMDKSNNNTWTLVSQPELSFANIQFLYLDEENNLFIASGQGLWQLSSGNASGNDFQPVSDSFSKRSFGIPRNQQFLGYWNEVKQRIYNIRHGLTISGQTDNLPLFSPPINPMDLVEAVGSGEAVAEAVNAMNSAIPYYRFEVMIEKAKEITRTVVQFGQSLLAALQAKDAQKLAELYNKNERHLLSLTQAVKQDNLSYAQHTHAALKQAIINAQDRQTHYSNLIGAGLSPGEAAELTLASTAIMALIPAEIIHIAAIMGYSMPTIFGLADGGFHVGDAINQGAAIAEGINNMLYQSSALAATIAGYQRRAQDWQLLAQLAQDDINQIQYQIVAAQYQEDMASQEINILQKQLEQQQKVAEFYKTKFTNNQLYSWYIGQLSGLYFQAYELAHDMALQAENAWKFEHIGLPLSDQKDNFIQSGYWNSLYEGLLAGESLLLDLQRMEKTYMDQNVRRFEITKTISLAQLDPVALYLLITTGTCRFDITENDFAWDYPGHYCRKIKSISVSIPMVVGPYQNLHAVLTQTGSKLINSDGSDGQNAVQYLLNPKNNTLSQGNTALQANLIPNQQIALSQGVNDTGMFELNFNDPRYLPFEGTGAVSSWQLDVPIAENAINYQSITDIILQINYTALPASSAYTTAVRNSRGAFNASHTISLAQASPTKWNAFINDPTSLSFTINPQKWKRVNAASQVTISRVTLVIVGSLPGSSLTLTDSTTTQSITLTQSTVNTNFFVWKAPDSSGLQLSGQTIVLSGLPSGTTSLPGLTNIIVIVDYMISNP